MNHADDFFHQFWCCVMQFPNQLKSKVCMLFTCAFAMVLLVTQLPSQTLSDESEIEALKKTVDLSGVYALTLSPDKKLVAGLTRKQVKIWSVESKEVVHQFVVPGNATALAFHPNSQEIATADGTGNLEFQSTVRIWKIETGKHQNFPSCLGAIPLLGFSPEGDRVFAFASFNSIGAMVASRENKKWVGGQIRVWDTTDKSEIARFDIELHGLQEEIKKLKEANDGSGSSEAFLTAFNQEKKKRVPKQIRFAPDGTFLVTKTASGKTTVFQLTAEKDQPAK